MSNNTDTGASRGVVDFKFLLSLHYKTAAFYLVTRVYYSLANIGFEVCWRCITILKNEPARRDPIKMVTTGRQNWIKTMAFAKGKDRPPCCLHSLDNNQNMCTYTLLTGPTKT